MTALCPLDRSRRRYQRDMSTYRTCPSQQSRRTDVGLELDPPSLPWPDIPSTVARAWPPGAAGWEARQVVWQVSQNRGMLGLGRGPLPVPIKALSPHQILHPSLRKNQPSAARETPPATDAHPAAFQKGLGSQEGKNTGCQAPPPPPDFVAEFATTHCPSHSAPRLHVH